MGERLLEMRIAAEFANVDLAREALRKICRNMFEPEGGAFSDELCLAASEAMNNAVEHSGAPTIQLEVTAERGGLALHLTYAGVSFDPTVPASLPDNAVPHFCAEGGYGLALMQRMVDTLEYAFRDGNNILTMYKRYDG